LLEQPDTSSPIPQSTDRPTKGVKHWIAPEVDPILPIINPPKLFPIEMEIVDICGWTDRLGSEHSLFSRHLAEVRAVDVIVLVARTFEDQGVPYTVSTKDFHESVAGTLQQLIAADLRLVEDRRAMCSKQVQFGRKDLSGDLDLLTKAQEILKNGQPLTSLAADSKSLGFLESLNVLTHKPRLILLNVGEDQLETGRLEDLERTVRLETGTRALAICGSLEREIQQIGADKWMEFSEGFSGYTSREAKFWQALFDAASQVVYVTFGHLGLKCWVMRQGLTLVDAAKRMHSDFAKNLAGGEVLRIEDLVSEGSLAALARAGKAKLRSKNYEVQHLDILYFKTTV